MVGSGRLQSFPVEGIDSPVFSEMDWTSIESVHQTGARPKSGHWIYHISAMSINSAGGTRDSSQRTINRERMIPVALLSQFICHLHRGVFGFWYSYVWTRLVLPPAKENIRCLKFGETTIQLQSDDCLVPFDPEFQQCQSLSQMRFTIPMISIPVLCRREVRYGLKWWCSERVLQTYIYPPPHRDDPRGGGTRLSIQDYPPRASGCLGSVSSKVQGKERLNWKPILTPN